MKTEKGFTLIELLVVIAIIGILAAIAVPQYSRYRAEAFCSRVMYDTKNAFTAMEAFYTINLAYPASVTLTTFKPTVGVNVSITSTIPLALSGIDSTGNCTRG